MENLLEKFEKNIYKISSTLMSFKRL